MRLFVALWSSWSLGQAPISFSSNAYAAVRVQIPAEDLIRVIWRF
jgi:hypothetical protein